MKNFKAVFSCTLLYMVLPTATADQDLVPDHGLQTCISHLKSLEEYPDLAILPGHLVTKTNQARTYYINATLTSNQTAEVLGFVCTTTSTGDSINELREFERAHRATLNPESEK